MNLLPDILQQAVSVFHDSKLTDIHKLIGELLEEDAFFSKSHQEMRFQECFAVSPEIDGLLDAARKLYLQTVEEIYLVRIFNSIFVPFGWSFITLTSCNLIDGTKYGKSARYSN